MRPSRALAALALATVTASLLQPGAALAAQGPHLEVIAAAAHVEAQRYGSYLYINTGAFLASLDAPFEVRVARASYADPIEAWEDLQGGATLDIPSDLLRGWWGFRDFGRLLIFKDGQVLRSKPFDWCPGYGDMQRMSDDGPTDPTYPNQCYGNPFTLGAVWGIDQGWAASLNPEVRMQLRDGTYTAAVRIAPAFRELFGISREDVGATFSLTVTSEGSGCPKCPFPQAASAIGGRVAAAAVPTDTNPDPDTLPDLIPLPSYGIYIDGYRGHDILTFGADVWNRGPAPLSVEGYRQVGTATMDAFQYFTATDGTVVGRAPVGGFEYDAHRGHQHWHFLQFARYQLLDQDQSVVVKSRKQAFCLAPTDAIDMLAPGAEWLPDYLGFSRCGDASALWIRETMPVGWGDTYFQGLFGQGFDVTHVPNGTYYIEVAANPLGLLYESDTTNDTSLRRVVLKGVPGNRHVVVPAWHGIDTEGGGLR